MSQIGLNKILRVEILVTYKKYIFQHFKFIFMHAVYNIHMYVKSHKSLYFMHTIPTRFFYFYRTLLCVKCFALFMGNI